MGFTLSQKETQASKKVWLLAVAACAILCCCMPGDFGRETCLANLSMVRALRRSCHCLSFAERGSILSTALAKLLEREPLVWSMQGAVTGFEGSVVPQWQAAVKMVDKVETPPAVIRREAELMKSLSHANIVRFHAVYFERCFVCIVMDKYGGGDLVDGMQMHMKEHGKINPRDIVHVSYQMAASIKYLHERHIAHRDIKGDNFLITTRDLRDQECKVALSDFGTAELVEGQRRLSSEVGTRIFWAPEIFGKSYGLKVDVWALGIIMYGLLDGRFPFKDEHDIKTKEPKYPKRLEPLCQDFIRVMLLKEEDVRATAEDVMVHRWLSSFAGRTRDKDQSEDLEKMPSSESRNGRRRSSESLEVPVQPFEHEEPNCSVAERRRELMERLNNEHAKGPAAVGFMHCASLTEFSVPDRRLPGAHWRYQWWDRKQIEAENLGPRNAEGHERTLEDVSRELDRSPHIVGKILQDYDIDIAKFGVGEAKTLDQLASEVQNGSARLMLDATTHKKLVRVVDVVLLRLYSSSKKDRLLIEVGEQYPDGRRRAASRLPGTKKFPYENGQETAFRILKDLLGVTARAANFAFEDTEVYEEEMDSPSFPGVRTVYRKEIMEGHLKATDEATALRIGLLVPGGSDWSVQDHKGNLKSFAWMTEQEAHDKKVKLMAEGSEEVSGLVMPPVGLNEEDLVAYLRGHSIDTESFGTSSAKTLKDLSRELTSGQSSLLLDASGKVVRVVDQVYLVIVSPSDKVLVEVAYVTPDGTKHMLNRLPGTNGRPDESQFVTARHLLHKQIRIDPNQVRLDPGKAQIWEESRKSPSMPSISTVYRRRFIEATVMVP
ncbi:par-1 [Symbiodinium natans]|uniref:Par-1 protein n=1 Tax=Symbiodinium natans TaxID=878477 RepID=A0A812Q635_9DINO|nr:par-1 [Symbiodinium natans]